MENALVKVKTYCINFCSAIGLNIASSQGELQKLVARTMFSIQQPRFSDVNAKSLTNNIIEKLIRSKAITPAPESDAQIINVGTSTQTSQESSFCNDISLSQKKRIILKSKTKLQVEMLGKSSFKSGIDFNRSKIVYADLQKAQQSLVLLDYFHLLYIVTPYDEYNQPPMPDRNVFYNKVKLPQQNFTSSNDLKTFFSSTVQSTQSESSAYSSSDWYK